MVNSNERGRAFEFAVRREISEFAREKGIEVELSPCKGRKDFHKMDTKRKVA